MPDQIVLDLDATDIPLYGHQPGQRPPGRAPDEQRLSLERAVDTEHR